MKSLNRSVVFLAFAAVLASLVVGCGDVPLGTGDGTAAVVINLPGSAARMTSAAAQGLVRSYGIVIFENPSSGSSAGFFTKDAIAGTTSVTFDKIKAATMYTAVVLAFGQDEGIRTGWSDGTSDYVRESPAYVVGMGEAHNLGAAAGQQVTTTISIYPIRVGGYISGIAYLGGYDNFTQVTWTGLFNFGSESTNLKAESLYFSTLDREHPLMELPLVMSMTAGTQAAIPLATTYYSGDQVSTLTTGRVAIDVAGLKIACGDFARRISYLWPTLPVTSGTMGNSLGRLYGYTADSANAYNLNGEMNSWPGAAASLAATIGWAAD